VLAGGAVRGAYEAGALYGMFHQSADADKSKFDYDVLTGVSAGAINVGAMSMFEKTDTERMLDILSEEW
jgi:predicted acylesterase/phospholipase RssA